jgi:hypothetical protein
MTYEGSAGKPESAPVEVALGWAHADVRHVEVLGNSTTAKDLHLELRRPATLRLLGLAGLDSTGSPAVTTSLASKWCR